MKHWKPERIGICMAIYEPNHEDFLHQLDSISRQTHTNWVCQISSDSDLSQIRKNRIFESYFSDSRFLWIQNEYRLGVKENFQQGIIAILKHKIDALAFSDQDDIWLPEKLEYSLKELARAGKGSLVHSDLDIFSEGSTMGSAWKAERRAVHLNDTINLLMCNTVSGCSSLMDADLVRRFPTIPDSFKFHDHWYSVIASLNGGVYPIHKSLIKYRIHESNVVGVNIYSGPFSFKKNEDGGFVSRLINGSLTTVEMERELIESTSNKDIGWVSRGGSLKVFANGFWGLSGFIRNWFFGNGPLAKAYLGFSLGSFLSIFIRKRKI